MLSELSVIKFSRKGAKAAKCLKFSKDKFVFYCRRSAVADAFVATLLFDAVPVELKQMVKAADTVIDSSRAITLQP